MPNIIRSVLLPSLWELESQELLHWFSRPGRWFALAQNLNRQAGKLSNQPKRLMLILGDWLHASMLELFRSWALTQSLPNSKCRTWLARATLSSRFNWKVFAWCTHSSAPTNQNFSQVSSTVWLSLVSYCWSSWAAKLWLRALSLSEILTKHSIRSTLFWSVLRNNRVRFCLRTIELVVA